jgi:hypothetical protein
VDVKLNLFAAEEGDQRANVPKSTAAGCTPQRGSIAARTGAATRGALLPFSK